MNTKQPKKKDVRPNPLNDFLFMKYMGEEGDEEQLLAFLKAVLQRTGRDKIETVRIVGNKHISADLKGGKSNVLDVRAEMNDGTKVNIEVQLRTVGDMDKRSLYYWSREYTKSIHSGNNYTKLPVVIAINIVGAEFLPIDEVHSSFHLWEDSHKDFMLTDVLEIHFIDMVKFRRLKNKDIENNPLHRWLTFFDKNTNESTIKKITEMDATIERAMRKIRRVLQDEDMLRIYEGREMAAMDYTSGMDYARQEGLQKGITIGEQKGEQKTQMQYVLRLFQAGWTVEQIAEFTGLSAKKVKAILKSE